MEIERLRTLLAVLEHGSFTRAAEAVNLSQSTVSFQIKALEDSVGARLLDRNRDQVRPTAQGRLLQRYAVKMISLHAEAIAKLRAEADGHAGTLALAASTIPAEHILPPALAALRRTHPGLSITMDVSDSSHAIAMLLEEACDAAVVGTRVRDKRLVQTAIAEDEVVLIGPVPNRFSAAKRLTPADLAGVPLVLRCEGSGTRAATAPLLSCALDAERSALTRVGSTQALKQCVLEGMGLAFISRLAVAAEVRDNRLQILPLEGTPVHRSFFWTQLRAKTPSAGAAALAAILSPHVEEP